MTTRDIRSVHNLYYFHRYIPSSIARLYGVSPKHIISILREPKNESLTVVSETECQICSADECQQYYIDGDKENTKPQNIIMLCEPDLRKFQHLQVRKRKGLLTPQLGV